MGIGQLQSKKIWSVYNALLERFGSELAVLLDAQPDDIEKASGPRISGLITSMRNGNAEVVPGYDGVYGILKD